MTMRHGLEHFLLQPLGPQELLLFLTRRAEVSRRVTRGEARQAHSQRSRPGRACGPLLRRWQGCSLLSVSEQVDTRTPAGRLMLNVLGAVSQWEREAIGERTSVAMQHKASRGEYIGGRAPFGFDVDGAGRLVEREDEQAIMREARALRAQGLSLAAVAGRLQEFGFRSRVGRAFVPMQVARMVQ